MKFNKEVSAVVITALVGIITISIFFGTFLSRMAVIETEILYIRHEIMSISNDVIAVRNMETRIAQFETKLRNMERRIDVLYSQTR